MTAPAAGLWRCSPFYRDLDVSAFRLVSFDVFDTLVHRAVRRPVDVFLHVARRAIDRGLLDCGLDPYDFAALRARMETEARREKSVKAGSDEVTLADVWRQAPPFLTDPDALMAVELDVEEELSFGNPYAISFVHELKRRGILVCLVSDTYLSAEFVKRLLRKAGLLPEHYAAIFVSCEHDANKARATLFGNVVRAFAPLDYADILHVGDDLTSDCIQPASLGMGYAHVRASHPSADAVQRETLLGTDGDEDNLAAVRQLGELVAEQEGGRDNFFLRFGAATLGPTMAAFCAWVVSDAARRGITKICPIMREGAILAPLMRRAAQALGMTVEVEAIYSSRRAAFLPSMGRLNSRAVEQFRSRRNFTLNDLIAELGLPKPPPNLLPHGNLTLVAIPVDAGLNQWLASDEVQEVAANASAVARALLAEYLDAVFGTHANVALVDLGPAGNTLAWISECQAAPKARQITNYLFYATDSMVANMARGHFFRTFSGSLPDVRRLSQVFNRSHEPFEILLTGAYQTTVGYEREQATNRVVPVTRRVVDAPAQEPALGQCERGIGLAWQHFEHAMAQVPLDHLLSTATRRASVNALCRVLELPMADEARFLGDLIFDDNAGSGYAAPICGEIDLAKLSAQGADGFVASFRGRWGYHADGVRWPQGTVTRKYPDLLMKHRRRVCNDVEHRFVCRDLVDRAIAAGHPTVTAYGGGKVGYELVQHAESRGVAVDLIVDSNPVLHGSTMAGHRIVSLETARAEGCGTYLVASVAFAAEITRIIDQHYRQCGVSLPTILSIKD